THLRHSALRMWESEKSRARSHSHVIFSSGLMRSSLASFARLLRRREEVIQFAEDTVDIAPALDEMPFAGQDQTPHARSAFLLRDKIKPSGLGKKTLFFPYT